MVTDEYKSQNYFLRWYWPIVISILVIAVYVTPFFYEWIPGFRSEYKPIEQLSKLLLLLGFWISIIGYRGGHKAVVALGSAFAMLTAVMYLSESNFIPTEAQPFLGLALGIIIVGYLKSISIPALISLLVTGLFLLTGFFADFISDQIRNQGTVVAHLPPGSILIKMSKLEELFEVAGLAFLLQAIYLPVFKSVNEKFKKYKRGFVTILVSFLPLTVGNSLLHFQYDPSIMLRIIGCILSYIGLTGIIFANQKLFDEDCLFTIGDKSIFHFILFCICVVLPTVHAEIPKYLSALIWVPCFIWIFYKVFLHRLSPST